MDKKIVEKLLLQHCSFFQTSSTFELLKKIRTIDKGLN